MTSTDIALRDSAAITERDVVDGWITVVSDVAKLSDHIAETDFVPKALRNKPAAIAACILTGRELGIGPMASLKSIHMVLGVPSLSAEYKRARALAAGHQIVIDDSTSTRCVVRGRRNGADGWVTITWTMDMARRAKLAGKDIWQQYPQRMLQARATSELCDLLFPDASLGLETTEVMEDGGALVAAIAGEAAEETAAAPPPAAAQRTARRGRAQNVPPAESATPPAPAAAPVPPAGGTPLPPLPGEGEITAPVSGDTAVAAQPAHADATGPGAAEPDPVQATTGQVGMMQGHFKRLGFEEEDREQRLATAATIAGMPEGVVLGSLKLLTQDQAKAVIDTLSRCKDRERLIAVLAAGEGSDD